MAIRKLNESLPIQNGNASMLHAGTVNRPDVKSLNYGDAHMNTIGLNQTSGVIHKPVEDGDFNVGDGYIAMMITKQIAGRDVNFMKSGSGNQNRSSSPWRGYHRVDLESYDQLTGVAVYGDNAGDFVPASGLDGTTGRLADKASNPTYQVPGTLVYMTGAKIPVQKDFDPRTL